MSAIPVEEPRDPSLIRKSLILVMLTVVSLYLVLNVALVGSVGAAALAASPAPIATASMILFAHAGPVVAFIGIIAMLSAMNAYVIETSRIIHSLSARFAMPGIMDLTRQGDACGCACRQLCCKRTSPARIQPFRGACHNRRHHNPYPVYLLLYSCQDPCSGNRSYRHALDG